MPAVIVADHLYKRYGSRSAVEDVSFEVEEGQVLGLLGPNGSGKSTILRILTGYLSPSSGRAFVAGHDVTLQSLQARRCIGYVPEDVPLYPTMSVDEFFRFMAGIKGLVGAAATAAIDAAASQLDLAPVRRLLISKLSRGYRQRVAIAQALFGDPPLLVLDEPTNGLDPRQIIDMRHLIRRLARRHTIIVTSHVLTEIEQVASHVAILLEGRLLKTMPLQAGQATGRLRIDLVTGDADAVAACAHTVSGITVIACNPGAPGAGTQLLVEASDEQAASALAAALLAGGFGLRRLLPLHSDLESLFLQLTNSMTATAVPA